jgi:hypothetical protein
MGAGAAVHVIAFTIGGEAAVEFATVPRGQASLTETGGRRQRVIALAVYCIGITPLLAWRRGARAGNKHKKDEGQREPVRRKRDARIGL